MCRIKEHNLGTEQLGASFPLHLPPRFTRISALARRDFAEVCPDNFLIPTLPPTGHSAVQCIPDFLAVTPEWSGKAVVSNLTRLFVDSSAHTISRNIMFRINRNPFEAVFPMCQRGRIVQKILNGGRYKTFFCICTCAAIFISAVYGAVDQHQAEVFSAYILGAFVFAAFHRSKRNSILRICALDLRSAE